MKLHIPPHSDQSSTGNSRHSLKATWKALVRVFPPDLVIHLRVDEGVDTFKNGLLSAMSKSRTSHPSGRRLRRRSVKQGVGYAGSPLRGLVLTACLRTHYRAPSQEAIDEQTTKDRRFFEVLCDRLSEYRRFHTPGKGTGGRIGFVNFVGPREDCHALALEVAPRFTQETDGLYMWDRLWELGTDTQMMKRWKEEWGDAEMRVPLWLGGLVYRGFPGKSMIRIWTNEGGRNAIIVSSGCLSGCRLREARYCTLRFDLHC